jgi:putative copper export protein
MALMGFAFCSMFMLYISIVVMVVFFNGIGQYNIGGVPNSIGTKIGVTFLVSLVGFGWHELIAYAPFEVVLK